LHRRLARILPGLILLASSVASAQSTNATISGLVADPSGKPIPGANLEILNDATGVQYAGMTNGEGIYTVSILPPGKYRVQVSKGGFKTLIKPDIILNVETALALNFTLPIGARSESITVEGGASLINTTDAAVSTVIDRKFVENIPLNGRSFQDLISMTPGVVTQSPQSTAGSGSYARGYSGDFSVNGQRTESNYYTVDGVTGNIGAGNGQGVPQAASAGAVAASTALGTTQSLLSVDALQEFRVQSSTYSAEFGRSPGGQFSFATRSGTNDFHGAIFNYLRNDALDASDWFNDFYRRPKPALRQNDFGGTLGGPVRIPRTYDGRNRSFFFVSYEGLRLSQPQPATLQYVPDVFLRKQAPNALQPILNAFPIQNGLDYGSEGSPSLAQFIESYSLPSRIDSTSVRVDHTFSPKVSLFFRFGDTPSYTDSRSLSVVNRSAVDTRTYTLGVTSQLSATLTNEFRLGQSSSTSSNVGSLDSFGGAQPINLARAMAIGDYGPNFESLPQISVNDIGITSLATGPSRNGGQQWNLVDSLDWIVGKHRLKFGIDFLHVRSSLISTSPYVQAFFSGANSVLDNQATIAILSKRIGSTPVFGYGAAYIQDEWRLNRRFTLSGGIRWEIDPPPTEAHGNDAYTLFGSIANPSSLALAPRGTSLWNTTFLNFAPRVGIAWQVHSDRGRETVVRAGFGVFYDSDNSSATQGYQANAIGFSATQLLFGTSLPITPVQLDFSASANPPFTSSSAYAFPRHLQLPYTLQWNTSLEQAIGANQSFTLSYVGANGRRLLGEQQLNVASANPTFSTVVYFDTRISSSYNALQLKYQRSVAHGLQALGSYSWSHSIDYGSAATALPLTRAVSDFDVRQNVSGGLSWDLPRLDRRGVAATLLGSWGLDGRLIVRTGFPLTLGGNLLTDPNTASQYNSGVNFVAGMPLYLRGANYPGGKSLNPSAFVANASLIESGDVPRNYFRGFGETQLNCSLRRNFALGEVRDLRFRIDAFNVFNHPNFGTIDTVLSDATFGQATATLSQSLTTVAAQYQQGGPRSLQVSLKLLF
jgi:hypothetical protein